MARGTRDLEILRLRFSVITYGNAKETRNHENWVYLSLEFHDWTKG